MVEFKGTVDTIAKNPVTLASQISTTIKYWDMDESMLKQLNTIINQVFDLEKKVGKLESGKLGQRNFRRIKESWQVIGLSYHDPIGEAYDETRTDCEASISGESGESLYITETLKPIIRFQEGGFSKIVQRAVVIVEQK